MKKSSVSLCLLLAACRGPTETVTLATCQPEAVAGASGVQTGGAATTGSPVPAGSLQGGFAGSVATGGSPVTAASQASAGAAGQAQQASAGATSTVATTPIYGACDLVPAPGRCLVASGRFRVWEWSQASGCWPQQIDGRAVVFDCYSSAEPLRLEGQFVWQEVDGVAGCQLCGGYSGTFAE